VGQDKPRGVLQAKRPTSRDVAAAGVSRATVSYVLKGADAKHRITRATRERVLEVAERLGYEPNAVALALRAGRPRAGRFAPTGEGPHAAGLD